MEMETLCRYGMPAKIVILNNGGIGPGMPEIPNNPMLNMRPNTLIYGARYDKMMQAFGGYGAYVEDVKDVRGALDELMNFPGPGVVNVDSGNVILPVDNPRAGPLDVATALVYNSNHSATASEFGYGCSAAPKQTLTSLTSTSASISESMGNVSVFGSKDAKQLAVITPAIMGPGYFREAREVLMDAEKRKTPPDAARMVDIFRRSGMTIAAPPAH